MAVSEPLFSANWYRVAQLKPQLRSHAVIHRHVYRGQVWYVAQDQASARVHRFTPAANSFIGLMNGERTVDAIWQAVTETLGDDAPTQDQVVELLGRLHQADLLQTQARTDGDETERRREKGERTRLAQRVKNPLGMRIPLFDPDRLLDGLKPLARVLFSPAGAVVWLLLVMTGLAAAGSHAAALVAHGVERVTDAENLMLLALVFPFVKLLHELGHGLAVKRWDGHVHEVGIMLLVLAPLPYVDASGAAAFGEKYRRIVVSAAGIAVELALAAAAALVWVNVEPGLVRDVAFDVMLIGGVSTLLFNGNPLLRFDGYFVLADLVEIPNLAERSRRYLGYLVLRHVFRVMEARSPVTAPGEAPWFVVYGISAALYRVLVAVAIIAFVAGRFFVVGVVLAALAAVQMLLLPLLKQVSFLVRSPMLQRRRALAMGLTASVLAGVLVVLVLAPAPLATRAEGVVWLPEDAKVRPGTSGFVHVAHVTSGSRVHKGDVLFELEDPLLLAQIEVLRARISELQVEKALVAFRDRVKAAIVGEQLLSAGTELEQALERAARLTVISPADGTLVLAPGPEPAGRFVKQGEEIGVVLDRAGLSVRAVVEQADISLLRERLESVQVRFADRTERTLAASLVREVPAGNYLLPSPVLGTQGGGRIPVEAADSRGLKVTSKVFQVELELPEAAAAAHVGQRVHVRFGHGAEPLAWQWGRRLEQIFLRGFGV